MNAHSAKPLFRAISDHFTDGDRLGQEAMI